MKKLIVILSLALTLSSCAGTMTQADLENYEEREAKKQKWLGGIVTIFEGASDYYHWQNDLDYFLND